MPGRWKPGQELATFPLVSRLPFSLDQSQAKMELTRAEVSAEKVAEELFCVCSVFSEVYLVFYFSSTYKIKQVSLFDISLCSAKPRGSLVSRNYAIIHYFVLSLDVVSLEVVLTRSNFFWRPRPSLTHFSFIP